MKLHKQFILLISFIEGGSVMFVELTGAKMVAPYFGTSLYVWASAIGITLGSLALGYFTGGYLSKKIMNKFLLFWIFLFSGFFILIMPHSGIFIMQKTINLSIQTGVSMSMLFFLMPPLVLCGMMSPLIIKELTLDLASTGRVSGLVYSISTIGGILFTYFTGFYLLPNYGIIMPAAILGIFIIIIALIFFITKKKYFSTIIILLILKPLDASFHSKKQKLNYVIQYENEGVFGQVKVVDQKIFTHTRGWKNGRNLFVNNISQSSMDLNNPEYSLWDYSYYLPLAASVYPKGSNALVLGMGAGTLLKQFNRLGFHVKAVEIDERIKDVAYKYFNLEKKFPVVIDDARHFLKTNHEIFDIIAFDLFQSETPPIHLLTKESFIEVKQHLKDSGLFMINFYGFISGSKGLASRSLYKTLKESGFYVKLLTTPGIKELNKNLIFLASLKEMQFNHVNYSEPGLPEINNLDHNILDTDKINFSDAIILTDNYSVLEKLYLDAAIEWRIANNKGYSENFIRNL